MHRETPHDIHRVQRDLAAMQDALGTGYPFDRKTCAAWLAIAKLVAGPIVAGFLLWQVRVGTPVSYLVSSTAFFVGVVVMVYATTSPWRRVGFGLAVPLLVFGAAVPILSPSGMLIAAAGTGVVAGLSCASIIAIQMRSLVTSPAP